MVITKMAGAGLAIVFLLAVAAAGIAGWHRGHDFLLNAWVQEQAKDVQGHIGALQKLRSGDANAAVELLETQLDDDLVTLEPEGYQLQAQALSEMHAALDAARGYRGEFPRESRRGIIDEMVRNALSREIPESAD